MTTTPFSIGREQALLLAEARHWENMTMRERAEFQMGVQELTMPFNVFHEAVEKTLGRPVFTHEFGLNWKGIWAEIRGERPAPTLAEIINLIPAEKRVLVTLEAQP